MDGIGFDVEVDSIRLVRVAEDAFVIIPLSDRHFLRAANFIDLFGDR